MAELDRICAAERRGGAHFVTVFQHRFASSGRAGAPAAGASAPCAGGTSPPPAPPTTPCTGAGGTRSPPPPSRERGPGRLPRRQQVAEGEVGGLGLEVLVVQAGGALAGEEAGHPRVR